MTGGGRVLWSRACLLTYIAFAPCKKADQYTNQALKNATGSPFLKSVMDRRAALPKPLLFHGFPLAACPLHIPNPVDNPLVVRSFASWPYVFRFLRQYPPQSSPQRSWHLKIIDILRFFAMILAQGVSVLIVVWLLQSERDTSSFSTLSWMDT